MLFNDLILIMRHRRAAKSRIADPDGADVPIALRSLIFCSGAVKADRASSSLFGLDPTYLGESCKNLSSRGFELTHWSHARQNHRRIDVRIRKRNALESSIVGHADRQTEHGKYAPQSDGHQHPGGETMVRDEPVATTFET
jgi:hypothetical protein